MSGSVYDGGMTLQDRINIAHGVNRNFVLNCVLKEVSLGLRFCHIMRSGLASPEVFIEGEQRAQQALQRAEEYMWKLPIAHPKFDQLTSQVERLRFELNDLENKEIE
jgi:hypothetical protein